MAFIHLRFQFARSKWEWLISDFVYFSYYFVLFRDTRVLGFTRKTVIALTTNIESIEHKRRKNIIFEIPVENPRSGTTDDVECMFSVMRDLTGKHFTLQEVRYTWRKVCLEFAKRMDPQLGYYYFTTAHDRFQEGNHPHFDKSALHKKPKQRLRRRE